MSDSKWLVAEHRRRNQMTINASSFFASHRQHVMQQIKQSGGISPGRLCVVGSGNCNDLDLIELNNVFQEIVLVDLDHTASESAVDNRFPNSERKRIQVADSTDVTGIFARLQSVDVKDPKSSAAQELMSLLSATPQLPAAPYDCIVSTCLMSQLIDSVILAMGINHPAIVAIILAMRRQHFRTILQSLVVGGRGLVIFDFVSSQTLPSLIQIDEGNLNQTLIEAINAKNFFTGLNPFAVLAELHTHSDFAGLIGDVSLHSPWRWDMGKKQFAVSSISFRRSQ